MTARLSLAIAAKGPVEAFPFWASIEQMGDDGAAEFQLVYDDESALAGKPDHVRASYRKSSSLFDMWGHGIAQSTGDYVAILHLEAPPAPGWLDCVLGRIASGSRLICGPVEADYDLSDRRWVGYLVEYCQFKKPIRSGLSEIPGNNLVMHRDTLPAATELAQIGFSKTRLKSVWTTAGLKPDWAEDAIVVHMRTFNFRAYLARRFHHGRSFAADRASAGSLGRRAVLTICSPLVAPLRIARIFKNAWRSVPLRAPLFRYAPEIALSESFWAIGEFVGYLTEDPSAPATLD